MAATSVTSKTRWMIYGANGYTGRIAARLPRPEGMEAPILAGRNVTAIRTHATRIKQLVHWMIEAWNSNISLCSQFAQSPLLVP